MYTRDDYSKGAILKIIFHDFLTYHHVECVPGPYMNVIIGPNGTGKSTIICGICLASGGSPKMLGRSDVKGDFIRHGKTEGFVEMHLKDDKSVDGVKIFKISLRQPNVAFYFIDGKKVLQKDVQEEIAGYNIQVDNPCTFLAQDKVKSFAEQDSKGLLVNTMKAGPEELMKTHKELIEKAASKDNQNIRRAEIEADYKRLVDDLERTRVRAEKYLERRQANKKIQAFRSKRVYLKLESGFIEYEAKSSNYKEAKRLYKDVEDKKRPLSEKLAKVIADKSKLSNERARLEDGFRDLRDSLRTAMDQFKKCFSDDELKKARVVYNDMKVRFTDWEKEMEKHAGLVKTGEQKLKEAEEQEYDDGPAVEKRKELTEANTQSTNEWRALERRERDAMNEREKLEREAEKTEQAFTLKFNAIRHRIKDDSVRAWNYYLQNKRLFKYPVYVPLLFMQIQQANHVLWNNLLSIRDATIFVFGCQSDEAILMNQQRFRINSTVIDPKMVQENTRDYILPDHLRRAGFKDYVINSCKTVEPVKAFLVSVSRLHTVPFGGTEVDQNSEQIAHQFKDELGLFMTDRSRVDVSKSRYDSSRVTVSRSLYNTTNAVFTDCHTRPFEQEETPASQMAVDVLKQIDDEKVAWQERKLRIKKLEMEVNELEKFGIAHRDRIAMTTDFLKKAKRRVEEEARQKPNLEKAKKDLEAAEKLSKDKLPKILEKVVHAVKNLADYNKRMGLSVDNVSRLAHLVNIINMQIDTIQGDSLELSNRMNELAREEAAAKSNLSVLKKELKEFAECSSSRIEDLKQEDEKQAWYKMMKSFEDYSVPNDVNEIEEEIAQSETMLDARDKDGKRQDVDRLAELVEMEKKERNKKAEFENKLANWEEEMKEMVDKWVKPLEEIVEKISVNFSSFFTKIGCAGEVRLHKPDDPLNINEYGIDIYVQFIGYNKMHRLTAQQQSGGERSVSTMLYLMALQELCPVPFRCVDEINQGMDATNERKVFNMMVDLLSDDKRSLAHSQYFILTPKLLPGLHFNEKVTVLIIQNSPMMTDDPGVLRVKGVEIEV